jgi:hypothetical protein
MSPCGAAHTGHNIHLEVVAHAGEVCVGDGHPRRVARHILRVVRLVCT